MMAQSGKSVKHYHSDNGRFVDNIFVDTVNRKSQKLTLYGVVAHHQNGIIKNKNKILTTGAQTLLLNGTRIWPQMIDDIFWPFAMKAVAERLKNLQVDILGWTPESMLRGDEVQDIPVNLYLTLFCPNYELYARLQRDGGAGPPKWELRSQIEEYPRHLPVHAGSVVLLWKPTTGRVSPQYYVLLDDDFSTVPYMKSGTLPPNCEHLVKYSSEMATTEDVSLADTWLNGQSAEGATDQLSDPFTIVTGHTKPPQMNTPGYPSPRKSFTS